MPPELLDDLRDYQAAKFLGVRPWEMADVPEYWIHRAMLFEQTTSEAEVEIARKHSRK